MAVVERFKQESMYGLSAKIVAVVERWPLVEVRLYILLLKHFRFLFLLRVVAILANKVNSESQPTATFKFQVYYFATIQNIKYLNKKSPAWRENPRETTGPLN